MVTVARQAAETVAPDGVTLEGRKFRPIVAWAVGGAFFLAFQIYIFAAWIISGDAKATDPGPTPMPEWMKYTVHGFEVSLAITMAVVLYAVVIRPWRREGRITFDGLLVLAFGTLYWQDPLLNYHQIWFTYNAHVLDFGSWGNHIPGWMSPGGNLLPHPILSSFPLYAAGFFIFSVMCCAVMRKAKQRWPHLGKFGLTMVAVSFAMVLDIVLEAFLLLPLGVISYPGTISWMAINHGHYYQYPVYEALLTGPLFGACACLRYFRNDKGESFPERASQAIKVSGRAKTGVRFLALVGAVNVIYILAFNLPIQFFAMQSSPWPRDVTKRSYLMDGLCGEGTNYACPGPRIPIPRPDSLHVNPDGSLVAPN
jgi:hypothetical protein